MFAYFTFSVFHVTRDNYIKCHGRRTQAQCCVMGSQSAVLAMYIFLNLNAYKSKHRFIRNHQSQFMQRTDSSFMVESACQSVAQLGIDKEQVGNTLRSLILEVSKQKYATHHRLLTREQEVQNTFIGEAQFFKTAPAFFERSMLVSELFWRSVLLLTMVCVCVKAEGSFQVLSSAELATMFCFTHSPYCRRTTRPSPLSFTPHHPRYPFNFITSSCLITS